MLDKLYYLTTGVQKLPSELVEVMLELIEKLDELDIKKDYLQIFKLDVKGDTVHIIHTQEVPKYKRVEKIQFERPFKDIKGKYKIFVIDDGEFATIMLAEEY